MFALWYAPEENIRNSVEMWDTDAARDEMLAGRLLGKSFNEVSDYLPNVLIYRKDDTHSVKRTVDVCRGVVVRGHLSGTMPMSASWVKIIDRDVRVTMS
jgi:hypothetical protein